MNKNCKITVMTNSKVTTYTFDDYRVAVAICNLLDNVAEINRDNIPQIRYISKDIDILDNNE